MPESAKHQRFSRLLIIEDDQSQLRTLTDLAKGEGLDVTGCSTATEALDHFQREEFGVVILDLRLPDLDGTQLLKKLSAMDAKVRVIINTGHGSFDSAKEAVNLGAFAYVEKAGDPNELIRHLRAASRWHFDHYAKELEEAVAERTKELCENRDRLKAEITERKQVEEALRSERNFASNLIETAQAIILVLDSAGRIVRFNSFMEALSGYRLEEVKGKDWFSTFLPSGIRDAIRTIFRNAIDDIQTCGNVNPIIAKDGREILVEWHDKTLKDANGNTVGLLAIGSDVTRRKQVEAALQESEERHRTILQTAMDGFWMTDMQGCFLAVNAAYCRMSGYSEAELLAMRIPDLEASETSDETAAHIRKIAAQGEERFESRHRRKDGSIFDVEVSAEYSPIENGRNVGFLRDITERKRTEQALRESQERFLQMAENVGDVFWIASAERPATEYVSPAYETIWGRSRQSLYADPLSWIEAVHPDDRERVRRASERERIEGFLEEEYRIIRPDGTIRWVHDRGFLVRDASGKTIRVVGIARDITDRRQAEEQARQHQAELAHVARMSTMGEMASGLAHELNQPLTAVVNYAQGALRRLRSGGGADEEVLNALERATEQAHRAAEIIRRLANFVQKHEPRRSTCNLNDAVREVVRFLEADAREHGVRIDLDSSVDLPEILMDNIQIQQVILNLVRNGIEAMSEMTVAERVLGIRTSVAGDAVEVAVCDHGPGLTPDMQERIFTPFYTTKPRGMGMGLSISRSIIDAHGGRLWAASNPDRGTTFHFTLPFSAGAPDDEHRSDRLRRG